MANFDAIIIGAGPGGYVCAIHAAQLGLQVAVVEGRDTLGGTCLNVGCIPSKALLHATHSLHEVHENFEKMGLICGTPSIDWGKMQAYKQDVVNGNTKGIEFLLKKNKVTWIKGWASLPAPGQVKVGDDIHSARAIVIATGSEPSCLPGVSVDETIIVTSTGALTLPAIPKSMVVIGAGVIGLEMGSVYARLGTKVTVIEYLDAITPGLDGETAKSFEKILKKQGLTFILGAAVQSVTKTETATGTSATITYKRRKDDAEATIDADVVLVATGRKPFTTGLGLESLGVEMLPRGQIKTTHFVTNIPGLYAIGDATTGPMLAHKAEDEGMALAEILAGKSGHVNYDLIPGVIYTTPEVASIGATEEQLKEQGRAYKVGKFPFMGNARAKAVFQAEGFVKILADAMTDRILGAHIIGPAAGDLIHEVGVAMEFGASAQDLALTCHAHPTYSEAVREAALACGLGAIHA